MVGDDFAALEHGATESQPRHAPGAAGRFERFE
jgi:hypothetical protein